MMRNIIDGVAPEDAAAGRFLADFADCAAADQQSRARDAMRRMPASDRSDADLYWIAMLSNSFVKSADRLRYSVRYLCGPLAEFLRKRDFDLEILAPIGRPAKTYVTTSNHGLHRMSPERRVAGREGKEWDR